MLWRWLLALVRSPVAAVVVHDLEQLVAEQLDDTDPATPLSHAAVEHQRAQIASAARAFPPLPPPCPPSLPPSAPPPGAGEGRGGWRK
jgi:hypothetical protein